MKPIQLMLGRFHVHDHDIKEKRGISSSIPTLMELLLKDTVLDTVDWPEHI